jgi:hypothetical protein
MSSSPSGDAVVEAWANRRFIASVTARLLGSPVRPSVAARISATARLRRFARTGAAWPTESRICAVVPVEHDRGGRRERAFQVALEQLVRLVLVVRDLQGVSELGLILAGLQAAADAADPGPQQDSAAPMPRTAAPTMKPMVWA